jgi:hypothetical protein
MVVHLLVIVEIKKKTELYLSLVAENFMPFYLHIKHFHIFYLSIFQSGSYSVVDRKR